MTFSIKGIEEGQREEVINGKSKRNVKNLSGSKDLLHFIPTSPTGQLWSLWKWTTGNEGDEPSPQDITTYSSGINAWWRPQGELDEDGSPAKPQLSWNDHTIVPSEEHQRNSPFLQFFRVWCWISSLARLWWDSVGRWGCWTGCASLLTWGSWRWRATWGWRKTWGREWRKGWRPLQNRKWPAPETRTAAADPWSWSWGRWYYAAV